VAVFFSILVGAVVVLGGLWRLAVSVFRFAVSMRDNTTATRDLTEKMDTLTVSINGRFDRLAERVTQLEATMRARLP
jgi:hypothetical protein